MCFSILFLSSRLPRHILIMRDRCYGVYIFSNYWMSMKRNHFIVKFTYFAVRSRRPNQTLDSLLIETSCGRIGRTLTDSCYAVCRCVQYFVSNANASQTCCTVNLRSEFLGQSEISFSSSALGLLTTACWECCNLTKKQRVCQIVRDCRTFDI